MLSKLGRNLGVEGTGILREDGPVVCHCDPSPRLRKAPWSSLSERILQRQNGFSQPSDQDWGPCRSMGAITPASCSAPLLTFTEDHICSQKALLLFLKRQAGILEAGVSMSWREGLAGKVDE